MLLPAEIQIICQVFLAGLNQALGEKLFGVYLYGALTFPDAGPVGDIDFHVILNASLDSQEKSQIQTLHATLAHNFPPLGAELDGYYILLEDARRVTSPQDQLRDDLHDVSWALHCAHIRRDRCIVLQGPDPLQVYPEVTWPELEHALAGELDFVLENLNRYPAYCVLNLCRLMYSYTTREVVISKRFSAEWAIGEFPEWTALIAAAKKDYAHQATSSSEQMLVSQAGPFYRFACEQIEQRKMKTNGQPVEKNMSDEPQTKTNNPSIENNPSETAMATASLRAMAAQDERTEIKGPDYLAELFLTNDRKSPLKDRNLRLWVLKNKVAPGMYEFMIARTAFFDQVVVEGLWENIPQIVILGAGYDSRAYRFKDLTRDTRIFELDAPPTQQRKQEILRQAGIPLSERLVFVPVNFNTDDLKYILTQAGFSVDRQTLFIWEGVTYYLLAEVVDAMLESIHSISPNGSSLCFDYAALSRESLDEAGVKRLREIMKSNHSAEPTRFGIPEGLIGPFLSTRGYQIKEHLTQVEMEKRYLTLNDGTLAGKPPSLMCFVNATVCR
jgi:methyltransferase (TIGR00027 family)